jgi:hypothetical protein
LYCIEHLRSAKGSFFSVGRDLEVRWVSRDRHKQAKLRVSLALQTVNP